MSRDETGLEGRVPLEQCHRRTPGLVLGHWIDLGHLGDEKRRGRERVYTWVPYSLN